MIFVSDKTLQEKRHSIEENDDSVKSFESKPLPAASRLACPTALPVAALPVEEQEQRIEMAKRKADATVDGVNRARRGLGGSDEWFTPLHYIDAAMGDIDLDSATCT